MQAYGFSIKDTTESDCVAMLMKMYQRLSEHGYQYYIESPRTMDSDSGKIGTAG
jgi:hypothetical protein